MKTIHEYTQIWKSVWVRLAQCEQNFHSYGYNNNNNNDIITVFSTLLCARMMGQEWDGKKFSQLFFVCEFLERSTLVVFIYTTFPIHSHDDNRTQWHWIYMAMINDDIECARLFLWIQQFHLYKYAVSGLDSLWFFRERTTTKTSQQLLCVNNKMPYEWIRK